MRGDGFHIDFAQVLLSEYDDDKHLGVSLDHYGEAEAGIPSAEVLAPLGTIARPMDADESNDGSPDLASEALQMTVGDRVYAMPLNDPRVMATLPPVKKGGYLTYCPAAPGSFFVFDGKRDDGKNAGSFTLSTKFAKGTKAHLLSLDVRDDGTASVMLMHGDGMGLMMTSGGKNSALLRNKAGAAFFEANDDGLVLVGKTKLQGSLTVGQMAAADSLMKLKAFQAWAAAVEAKLAGLGAAVTPPFAALLEVVGTKNLKGS